MADKDTVTKEYMQDNAVFADAFNFYCYGGRQVIDPDQLKSIDTTAIALPYGNSETAGKMTRGKNAQESYGIPAPGPSYNRRARRRS